MTQPRRSRRRVLATGVAAGTLLITGPMTLAGCTVSAPTAPEEPDPLESPARRAESDVALARAVAGEHSTLAAVAGALAADRQAHATTLRAELRRANPTPAPSVPATGSGEAGGPASRNSGRPPASAIAGADPASAREALAAALRAAQQEATGLVATLPGFRAALLASVAACCASHAAMLP